MILPNNGKVVIIDDQPEDVIELISALSKEKVPFVHYKEEDLSDLPVTPIENVRLVFLDLELVTDTYMSVKNITSPIKTRLMKILKPNTAYVLIIWSKKENEYKEALLADFESDFNAYKPIFHTSLPKADIIGKKGALAKIKHELKIEISKFNSLNAFFLWESCVNEAAGIITNNFINIFEKSPDWDKNFCNLLYTLSLSQTGSETIKSLSNNEKLVSAFEIVNSTLIDILETNFQSKVREIVINEIKQGGSGIQLNEKIKLNTRIHLIKSNSLNHFFSGNLYLMNLSETGIDILKHNFKDSKLEEINKSNPQLVCLDITPTCDYSQRKNYTRILFGVIVDGKFSKSDLREEESRYRLCPTLEFNSSSYLILDYRHFKSFSKAAFELEFIEKPKYRLRNNLLLDIQAQLSNHINRPGIVTI